MHQFTENINRGKKEKREKDRQDICQCNLQFARGNNLAEGEERRAVQTEPLRCLPVLSQLPGARALQGTVSFQRDLLVNLILELKKCFLATPNQLKHIAGGRWRASPVKWQELNGKCIERQFFFVKEDTKRRK